MHSKSPAVAALKAAFPHTIPIFAGFLFLGMTYGVYMRTSGFSFWYPMIMSVVIFGGSLNLSRRACCSRRLRRYRSF